MVCRLSIHTHHSLDKNSQFEEVQNYFDAWGDVIGWGNWENSGLNSCLFKSKTQARVLLRRFPQIYEIAKQQFPEQDKLQEVHFRKVLRPLENIPFTHEDILKHYNHADRPEVAWQILDIWVKDAIANQAVYSIQDILSENERSVPGKGIISMPAASENLEQPFLPKASILQMVRLDIYPWFVQRMHLKSVKSSSGQTASR